MTSGKSNNKPGSKLLGWFDRSLGLSTPQLERIGALVVGWALFEHQLERAIWQIGGEDPQGARPSTDSMQSAKRIRKLRALCNQTGSEKWKEVMELFCDAAENILAIRNTTCHGHIAPAEVGGGTLTNPGWYGEKRKWPSQSLHISELTIGNVLDALQTLLSVCHEITEGNEEPTRNNRLLEARDAVYRAKMSSGEIRHLDELMNHEKY